MRNFVRWNHILLSGILIVLLFFPAALFGRSIPVEVVNQPEVQLVQEIQLPAYQPYQFYDTRYFDNPSPGGTTVLGTGIKTDPIPEGKRLVVQHISYRVSGEDILLQPIVNARVLNQDSGYVVVHPLPLTMSQYSDLKVLTVSIPITLYVDPGHTVGISATVRTTDNVSQTMSLTGYLIDLP